MYYANVWTIHKKRKQPRPAEKSRASRSLSLMIITNLTRRGFWSTRDRNLNNEGHVQIKITGRWSHGRPRNRIDDEMKGKQEKIRKMTSRNQIIFKFVRQGSAPFIKRTKREREGLDQFSYRGFVCYCWKKTRRGLLPEEQQRKRFS